MTGIQFEPVVVCFDLDGTLVDTAADLIAALNHALATADIAPVRDEPVRPVIGEGARAMILEALKLDGTNFSEPEIDRLWQTMVDYYAANIAVHSKPFDGTIEAITDLKSSGHVLTVCTNKTEELTHTLLNALELTTHFAAITCGDTFEFKKPDPRHLMETIRQAGANSQKAVMIGDSKSDILAAKNAGLPVIGVDWGYTRVPLSTYKPDLIISRFDDLTGAISKLVNESRN